MMEKMDDQDGESGGGQKADWGRMQKPILQAGSIYGPVRNYFLGPLTNMKPN